MPRPFSQKRRPAILATSVAVLFSLGFLLGAPKGVADEYWDGTNTAGSGTTNGAGGSGTWDNSATNWVDVTGTTPQVYNPADTAHFATTGGTVTLGDNITFTALSFDADGYTIDPGSGPFTLTATGTGTITAGASIAVHINPQITGASGVSYQGAGTIFVGSSSNNYTGGTTIGSGGTGPLLVISSDANLGDTSGGVSFDGGSLRTTASLTTARSITLNSGGGTFIPDSNTTFTVSGIIGGGGALTVAGTGATTLSGTNIYTGGTLLTSGATLYADNNDALGTGTLTINSTTTTLSTHVNGTTLANPISVQASSFMLGTPGFGQDLVLNGNVDLNGTTRTFVGITNGGQVHFGTGGIGTAGETAGVNFNTTFTATGDYVAFILDSGNVNQYLGLTTVNNGAFLVFQGTTPDGAIHGDVTIEGNGVVDYLGGSGSQIADTATVTVNSGGNQASGTYFGGLDLFTSSAETIGTLNGSVNGVVALGAANLTVGAGNFAGIIFDGSHTGISGGQITKVGPGTLILSGQNFYTGGTNFNGGIVQVSSDQNLGSSSGALRFNTGTLEVTGPVGSNRPVTLNAGGGTVQVDSTGILEWDGVIAGSGSLTKTGPGVFFITNANNTFTGGTVLTAGTINLSGKLVSTVTANNATGITTLINSGTITGTGTTSVNALGSAGITIGDFGTFTKQVLLGTGTNTVMIGTQIAYTPISAGLGVNDTLRLVGGGEDTLKLTDFAGYEFLNKVGGGMWTLTGSNPFSRGTTIDGGTLNVQGTLVSDTTVRFTGTLSGTGTVAGNVFNYGLVAPGTPTSVITSTYTPGTLSIKGNYTQNSAGTLTIQVNGVSSGQFSRLAATGRAQLAGNLVLQGNGNSVKLKIGQKVTFLTAAGGVNGKFSNVDNAFSTGTIVSGKLLYEANSVSLVGGQGSFMGIDNEFHLTYNQKAVAHMLDSAAADKRAARVMEFLDSRPLKKLPGDFDQIAPEEMAAVYRLGVSLSDVQARNVQRRTADLRAGTSGFSANGFQATGSPNYSGGLAGPTGKDSKTIETEPERRWGTFITGVGDFAHVGDSGNARGYDLNTGGVTVGADYKLNSHVAVGVTAGYAGTNANLPDDGRLLVNSGRVGVYGTYYTGGYYANAAVTGGATNYSTRRSSLEGVASGSTEGASVDVLVDTGYDWRMDALTIGPTASFQYTYVGIEGFTEHGSLTPLRYAGQHQSSIRSTFGLRMAYDWKIGNVLVRPEMTLAWQHEYGDRSYTIDSALASGAGTAFSVADTPIGRDSLLFGAGVAVLWNPRTSTYLYYDADLLKKEYNSQSVSGGLRMNF